MFRHKQFNVLQPMMLLLLSSLFSCLQRDHSYFRLGELRYFHCTSLWSPWAIVTHSWMIENQLGQRWRMLQLTLCSTRLLLIGTFPIRLYPIFRLWWLYHLTLLVSSRGIQYPQLPCFLLQRLHFHWHTGQSDSICQRLYRPPLRFWTEGRSGQDDFKFLLATSSTSYLCE